MKTAIVPAQVTTVEDRITARLTFTQLLLLVTPVFLSGAMFAFLPPFLKIANYKLAICGVIAFFCMILAVRVKGKLVLQWLSIVGRYNIRPMYYVYNKNDIHLRDEQTKRQKIAKTNTAKVAKKPSKPMKGLVPLELARIEQKLDSSKALYYFKTTKKGALRVYIQQEQN
jgi:hypothetical protein